MRLLYDFWNVNNIVSVWTIKQDDPDYKRGFRTRIRCVDGSDSMTTAVKIRVASDIQRIYEEARFTPDVIEARAIVEALSPGRLSKAKLARLKRALGMEL